MGKYSASFVQGEKYIIKKGGVADESETKSLPMVRVIHMGGGTGLVRRIRGELECSVGSGRRTCWSPNCSKKTAGLVLNMTLRYNGGDEQRNLSW